MSTPLPTNTVNTPKPYTYPLFHRSRANTHQAYRFAVPHKYYANTWPHRSPCCSRSIRVHLFEFLRTEIYSTSPGEFECTTMHCHSTQYMCKVHQVWKIPRSLAQKNKQTQKWGFFCYRNCGVWQASLFCCKPVLQN